MGVKIKMNLCFFEKSVGELILILEFFSARWINLQGFLNSPYLFWVSFNRKNGTIGKTSIKEIENQFGVRWLFHENEEVDIALIPFPINPETDDVMLIPNELFGSFEKLSELYEVFYLSFQPGVSRYGRVEPIIRTGVISFLDNDNKIFYIDGFVFPGNSGSPVFVKPSPIRFDNNDIVIGGNDPLGWKMVGVINRFVYSSLPVEENQFYNNTGLSIVQPIDFVNEILSQDSSKRLLEKIVERERSKE